ncbi:MAG: pentapeptide repeat-containing protein [Gammaproteobacteria bacterium]|nr:pentapeptide repeat-containing protein [Gammaproteobacteria bacterium]
MNDKPRISDCPMYRLLRTSEVSDFNARRRQGEACDLVGTDLSRLDLRGLEASGLDLQDCYFRMSDLRGIDFRAANLEGASFAQAHVSGCYFPTELRADELQLALEHGTRVRYR